MLKELLDDPQDALIDDALQMHFHRIKGAAGLFGYTKVGTVAKHIGRLLRQSRAFSPDLERLLLQYLTVVEALISERRESSDA